MDAIYQDVVDYFDRPRQLWRNVGIYEIPIAVFETASFQERIAPKYFQNSIEKIIPKVEKGGWTHFYWNGDIKNAYITDLYSFTFLYYYSK